MKRIAVHIDDLVFKNLKKEAVSRGSSVSRVAADILFLKFGRKRGRPLSTKEIDKGTAKK